MTAIIEYQNIFGETVRQRARGKHYVQPRGYAATPGTGPKGKTCKDCAHKRSYGSFSKCAIGGQSNCRATDILVKSPACSFFEESQK